MKRMLINATHSEEVRVALADGQKLYNLDIDVPGQEQKKGNIYKGKITRVEPSLEAAFVDYGANRHGFLPYKEISRNYYTAAANKMKERPPISVAVKEGTEVIIQVNKEERGNKGAAISTYISLAGRYLVYMPENPKAGGISRRIEGKARQDLKAILSTVSQPKDSGIIVRTAGIGRTAEELDWDINYLDQVWTAVKTMAANRKAPTFLYQETDIAIRAIRDYLRPDVGEILVDSKEIYEKARDFMQQVMPHNLKKLSYYNDTIPLFSRYQIESQIQSAFSREVHLPSGGSLVIDHTEAMISIDINSARATKGADIEETALNTNLEAADEIARQMRIRDLGGLLVIDFIDMRNHKNQRSVEQQLNEAVSNDRARIQTSKISRFGLLEMSRQRLKSSINESSQFVCPRCSGHGFIRNIESLSVSILRILEEEALKPGTGKVIAQVPTKVANFIINEKREELNSLESRHSVPMLIVANEFYQSPQYDITRLKQSEAANYDVNNIELNKPENEEKAENKSSQTSHLVRETAAVDVVIPESQVPAKVESDKGLSGWIKSLFASNNSPKKDVEESKPTALIKTQSQPRKYNKKPQSQHKRTHNKKPNTNQQATQNKQAPKTQQQTQGPKKKHPVKKNPVNKPQQKNANQANKPNLNKPEVVNKQNNIQDIKKQPQNKNEVIEESKNTEQLLQRPLGSVASYAKNKAKQEQQKTPVNADKNKSDDKNNETQDQKPVDKKPAEKTTSNNVSHTQSNVDKNTDQTSQKPKTASQVKPSNVSAASKESAENKTQKTTGTVKTTTTKNAEDVPSKAPEEKSIVKNINAKNSNLNKAKPTPTNNKVEKGNDNNKIADKPVIKQDKNTDEPQKEPAVKKAVTKPIAEIKNDTKKVNVKQDESKPVVEKPVVEKPVVEKPVVEKPTVKKPGVKKTATKKTTEKKPSVEKTGKTKADVKKTIDKPQSKKTDVVKQLASKPQVEVEKTNAAKPKAPAIPKKNMPDPTSGIDFDI